MNAAGRRHAVDDLGQTKSDFSRPVHFAVGLATLVAGSSAMVWLVRTFFLHA
jgi:hypothetical protein